MSKKLHGFMKWPQNGAKHVDALNTQSTTKLCAIVAQQRWQWGSAARTTQMP